MKYSREKYNSFFFAFSIYYMPAVYKDDGHMTDNTYMTGRKTGDR